MVSPQALLGLSYAQTQTNKQTSVMKEIAIMKFAVVSTKNIKQTKDSTRRNRGMGRREAIVLIKHRTHGTLH